MRVLLRKVKNGKKAPELDYSHNKQKHFVMSAVSAAAVERDAN